MQNSGVYFDDKYVYATDSCSVPGAFPYFIGSFMNEKKKMPQSPSRPDSSTARAVTIASAILFGSIFLSRALGVLRVSILSGLFGTEPSMDAYSGGFFVSEIINHLVAGGVLSITFIPLYKSVLEQKGELEARRFFATVFWAGTLLLFVLVVAGMIWADRIYAVFGKGLSDGVVFAQTVKIARIIIPAQIFIYWGALFMAVQYAHKKFWFPALTPLFYNAGIIVVGVALQGTIGIEAFAWGVLVGAGAGNVIMQLIGLWRLRFAFPLSCNFKDPLLKRYFLISIPFMLGVSFQFSHELFYRYFGSFLPTGSIASFEYAWRTMWSITGPLMQAVGVASYPFLVSLAVKKQLDQMNKLSASIINRLLTFSLPLVAVCIVLAPHIVTVLFQHRAFTAADTSATAPLLQLYLLGAPALLLVIVIQRNFYAMQRILLPVLIATLLHVLGIPGYYLAMKKWGAAGIAGVASAIVCVQGVVLLTVWLRSTGKLGGHFTPLLRHALYWLVVSLGGGLLCQALLGFCSELVSFLPQTTAGVKMHALLTAVLAATPALVLMFAAKWGGRYFLFGRCER